MMRTRLINIILLGIFFCSSVLDAEAQNDLVVLPVDTTVRYGVLSNGLTYYIKHNKYPEGQADFYIAQKVGSMQEEDNQLGLAHFLEHMAFNGTVNFKGRKTMLNYLEQNGAQFGTNVNAYTSYDETVYNLTNIPLKREGILDSCLLILHDWSNSLLLEDAEIDQERAIIKEEWRTRSNAQTRIWDQILPVVFEGSKYTNRMPIGSMDIVENFKYQELKDYYKKWYRPDLQGIVIVGDFDADQVESKVKRLFSGIPKPQNPAERIYYNVPDNDEPIIAIATDAEARATQIVLYSKHDDVPIEVKQSLQGYYLSVLKVFASNILNSRLAEISRKSNSPYLGASASDGEFLVSKTKRAWTIAAVCHEDSIQSSLKALLTENKRVLDYGFLDSEVERLKANLLQAYENAYNNRDKQRNSYYTGQYVRAFTSGEPFMDIADEYNIIKQILPQITSGQVTAYLRSIANFDKNVVITVTGPQKGSIMSLTKDKILSIFSDVKSDLLANYEESVSNESLINELPQKGQIIDEQKDEKFNTSVLTLSNGIKVILKKTDFKDDQIFIKSISRGGSSLFDDNEIINAEQIATVPSIGGLGNFSIIDLNKRLAGKTASVSCYVNAYTQGVSASTNQKDIETAMQLIYLVMTNPRVDRDSFAAYLNRVKTSLSNSEQKSETAFNDTIINALYMDNPRFERLKLEDLDKLNYDRMIEMYKECFLSSEPPVFTIVGSIVVDSVKPLLEKYISVLPVNKSKRPYVVRNSVFRKGEYIKHFDHKMETPKSSVFKLYSAYIERSQKNRITLNFLKQILDMVYTRTIREEEGGTYSVNTSASISRIPEGQTMINISFTTDTLKVADLNRKAHEELVRISKEGPEQEDFDKVKKYLIKNHEDRIKTNPYWLTSLETYHFYDEDNYSTYLNIIEEISLNDIRDIAKEVLKAKNYIEVIMFPTN